MPMPRTLDDRVRRLEEDRDAMHDRLLKTQETVRDIQETVTDISTRLGRVEADVAVLKTDVAELKVGVAEILRRLPEPA